MSKEIAVTGSTDMFRHRRRPPAEGGIFCVLSAVAARRDRIFSKKGCSRDIFRHIVKAESAKIMVEHGGRVMYSS